MPGLNLRSYTRQYNNDGVLDQFVKHTLKSKYYIRYVDDCVLFHNNREVLEDWQNQIEAFLLNSLGLQLHPHRRILKPVSCGINFLGYVIHRTHVLIRKKTINRFRTKIEQMTTETSLIKGKQVLTKLNSQVYMKFHSIISSYLGIFSHANSSEYVRSAFKQYFLLSLLFTRDNFRVTKKLCVPDQFNNIYQQHRYFHRVFDGIILMQVGCYLEAYDIDAKFLASILKYRYAKPLYGFAYRCGTHISNVHKLLSSLQNYQVMIAFQTGLYSGKAMQRQPGLVVVDI